MERLIDANELWKHQFKSASERMDLSVEYMSGWNDAIDSIVENSATVDPVKQGHWEHYLKEGLKWRCSECASRFTTPFNYCPHCGAKMTLD